MGNFLPFVSLPTGSIVSDICTGEKYVCVLRDDFSIVCWGENEFGALGFLFFQKILYHF